MKSTLTFLATLLCLISFGQIKFEAGYIVGNDGKKIECLIENKDWVDNPSSFLYKLSDNGQSLVGTLADVHEFGVYNYSRFVRASVQLDTSNSFVVSKLSYTKRPQWSGKTLFLKIIVTGNASLYRYQNTDILAFFFKTSQDSSIRQLVHKLYNTTENKVGENIDFKQQLINEVICNENQKNRIGKIGYTESDLKKHFTEYNTCKGDVIPTNTPTSVPQTTTKQPTRSFLNFKLTPGISYSSVSVRDDNKIVFGERLEFDFDKEVVFRVGLETEFILPFNKNKWGILFEPTYQYYESTKDYTYRGNRTATIEYRSIEFPIGLRYYSFLKEGSVFFNFLVSIGPGIDLTDSQITLDPYTTIDIESRISSSIGGGYARGSFSLEGRYYIPQNIGYNQPPFLPTYQRLVLIAGYRFAEIKKKLTG